MKSLTIMIPVYNAQSYIARCLESILESKEMIHQIILVDDGSSDKSGEICQKYQAKYSFIQYVRQENAGPSAARNKGIELATGDYLMFVDSDDYVQNLDQVQTALEKDDCDYYIFPNLCKIIKGEKHVSAPAIKQGVYQVKDNPQILEELVTKEWINAPVSKIYKKEKIDKFHIRFNPQYNMAEDLLFNIHYLHCCENLAILDDQLYYYCFENEESLTQRYLGNKYETLMGVNRELKPLFMDLKIGQVCDFLVYKNIFSSIKDFFHKNCKLEYREKINLIKQYKREHKKRILFSFGVKMLIWSIVFAILPPRLIYFFVKIGA